MPDPQPPRLARWLLTRALTGAARSAIVGDLDEEFREEALSRLGPGRARCWYWRQALRSIVDHRLQRPIGWKDRSERPGVRAQDVLRGERDALIADLRYAVRLLARQPGLTVVAVITLTLGIGSNVAIFSVLNATLLRPLPVHEPTRLFGIEIATGQNVFNRAWYAALKDAGPAFDGIAAYAGSSFLLDAQNGASSVSGAFVSGNYFPTLGLQPARGRLLMPADDRAGASPVAVISHRFWHGQFRGRPDIVGKVITVDGMRVAIVGVTPQPFRARELAADRDVYVPISIRPALQRAGPKFDDSESYWLFAVGRLAHGATIQDAQRAATTAFAQVVPKRRVVLHPADQRLERARRNPVTLFLPAAIAAVVLLIGCVNLAHLQLAHTIGRLRELSLRATLGASSVRLLRQLLAESVCLAALSGVIGLLAGPSLARLLFFLTSGDREISRLDLSLDVRVLGFTAGLVALSAIIIGLAPARQAARVDLVPHLKAGASCPTRPGRAGLRWLLVPTQVALSLLMVAIAAMLGRSLVNLQRVGSLLEPERVLIPSVRHQLREDDEQRELYQELLRRTGSLPGVESVALSSMAVLMGMNRGPFSVEGYVPRPNADLVGSRDVVTPGFFRTVGMALVRGRDFRPQDDEGAVRVAIVNETLARRYLGTRDPTRRRIGIGKDSQPTIEIVGVVRDFPFEQLRDAPPPAIFTPLTQEEQVPALSVYVRTSVEPKEVLPALRTVVTTLKRDASIVAARTLAEDVSHGLTRERYMTLLATGFGAVALILAAVGLYGVLAYSLSRRTQELGVRVALGSTAGGLKVLVLRETLTVVGVGLVAGLLLAWVTGRLVRSFLFGIAPGDPAALLTGAAVILATALLATWLPARRAARVDPVIALRAE